MAAQDREQARVYRWWGMVAFWVILYVSGILASVYWLVGGVATQTDVAATLAKLGAALLAAYSGYGIWRAGRSGVAVDPRSLRVRDIWRDQARADALKEEQVGEEANQREKRLRDVEAVGGPDVLLAGGGDRLLCLNHFNVAGHARGETVARLRELLSGEVA